MQQPSDDGDRSTRDLVIGLTRDVAHLREQIAAVLKLEERILAVEQQSREAKDFAARLLWATVGLGVGLVTVVSAVVVKVLTR
jgi:hypothetical protein